MKQGRNQVSVLILYLLVRYGVCAYSMVEVRPRIGVKYRHFECVCESGNFGRLRPKNVFHGSISSFRLSQRISRKKY